MSAKAKSQTLTRITLFFISKFTILILFLFFINCDFSNNTLGDKFVDCFDAEVCFKNMRDDTLYYSWGSSQHNDFVLPGELACRFVGEVKITDTDISTSIVYFNTKNGGSYAIKVEQCYTELIID